MSTNQRYPGPYELQQKLSSNAIYEVWRAFDRSQQRPVEVTILRFHEATVTELVPRFLNETKNLTALQHPGIAKTYEIRIVPSLDQAEQHAGFMPSDAYIVQEHIDGVSLVEYLNATARSGAFPTLTDIFHLFAPVCSALDYAHQHGIIHSRLKPAHVLLTTRREIADGVGEIKLTGFGLHAMQSSASLSLDDAMYVSPELAQGQTENTRSDIYSLGVMLYELCTGTLPFHGDTPAEILAQHIHTMPMSPALINPHIVPGMTAIILRCLAKEPSTRFATAASLMVALNKVLSLPGGSRMGQSGTAISGNRSTPWFSTSGALQDATYLSPSPKLFPQGFSASSAASEGPESPTYALENRTALAQGGFVPSMSPLAPGPSSVPVSSLATQRLKPVPVTETPHVSSSRIEQAAELTFAEHVSSRPPVKRGMSKRRMAIIGSVLLCLLVIGTGLATFLLAQHASVAAQTIYGHAFFVSSGLIDPNSPNGIVDGLQVDLSSLPAPAQGKSYYAWLLGDSDANVSSSPISLGQLAITNGHASTNFNSDKDQNLLANYSRFLITEEDATTPPVNPSLDTSTWRYGAIFSRTPSPTDTANHYSLLDHLRHLLAKDPKLAQVNLNGGLDIWLFRNTLKILEWSGSARDTYSSGNVGLIRRQAVRILDYLDGTQYIATENIPTDVSSILVDPKIARVPVLGVNQTEQPPAYLTHIGNHLREITSAPGVTANQLKLAQEISNAINNVKTWFMQVHDDAAQIVHMTPEQLRQPKAFALLSHMFKMANNAFVGETDPRTNQVKEGVSQIHYNAQRLATFEIMACDVRVAAKPCI